MFSAGRTKLRKVCSSGDKVYGWVRDILACVSVLHSCTLLHVCTLMAILASLSLGMRVQVKKRHWKRSVSLQGLMPSRTIRT